MTAAPDDPVSSRVRFGLIAITLLTGAVQCWRYRHFMYPDGTQYLDVGRQFATNGLAGLLNGCWSPLYPVLLGTLVRVLHPTAYWLYPTVQLINVCTFTAAVFAFDYFLRSVLALRAGTALPDRLTFLSASAFLVVAYAGFVVTVVYLLNVRTMSPDMMVAAVVFLVSGLLLHTQHDDRAIRWIPVGVALAVGYLAKTAMFPASVAYLISALVVRRGHRVWRGPAVAAVAFSLVAGPWLVALSFWKGRPMYGDTGGLIYALWVNGRPFHWTGAEPDSGVPRHPIQQLSTHPDAFAFEWPVAVTYPPFYDPTYWNEGLRPTFRLADQYRALRRTVREFAGVLRKGFSAVGPVFIVLMAAMANRRGWAARWWGYRLICVPAVAVLAMYFAVAIEARYIAAQLQVLMTSALAAAVYDRSRVGRIEQVGAAACVAAALVTEGPVAAGAARNTLRDLRQGEARQVSDDWRIARALGAAGLAPGDRIAAIGNSVDVAWAQLAGLSIIAEVPSDQLPAYLAADAAVRSRLLVTFRRVGVRAAVARSRDATFDADPWSRIAGTEFAIAMFGTR